MIDAGALYALGIALVFVGVLIIIVAVILLSISGAKKGKVKGGGAIIIGPVPIIFGTDEKSLKTVFVAFFGAYGDACGRHDCVLFIAELKGGHDEER